MKSLFFILVGMLASLLISCATQPQPQPKTKVQEGDIFSLERTFGGKPLTYNQALDSGQLVFARNTSGDLILSTPGTRMIPETLVVPETRGFTLWDARKAGYLALSWKNGEVYVYHLHRP